MTELRRILTLALLRASLPVLMGSWPLRLLYLSSIRLLRIWRLVGRRKERLTLMRETCLTGLIAKLPLVTKVLLRLKAREIAKTRLSAKCLRRST